MTPIPEELGRRLHREGHAERWSVPLDRFVAALQASVDRAAPANVERYLAGLHLEDLALACACAAGDERAWDLFLREHRPTLYRAADALDPSGGARELADSLYADLYGLTSREGERSSLFRYFHGRSSLATWLRAVLAQRHVDAIRARRRFEPLPEADDAPLGGLLGSGRSVARSSPDPDRTRYLEMMQRALETALSHADDRARLRLACYYMQGLTLAETGRILHEHEATVSRQLARTRKMLRREIERRLREVDGLDTEQVEQCFASIVEDSGPLNLSGMLRKDSAPDRSI